MSRIVTVILMYHRHKPTWTYIRDLGEDTNGGAKFSGGLSTDKRA
jgi:hypothetical protein